MTELGELDKHHADFAQRNARLVAVSIEGVKEAEQTQKDFPHLTIVADPDQNLANTVKVIHPHAAPDGGDAAAPTTILVDRAGTVKWLYRPQRYIERLSPDELLAAVDEHLPSR